MTPTSAPGLPAEPTPGVLVGTVAPWRSTAGSVETGRTDAAVAVIAPAVAALREGRIDDVVDLLLGADEAVEDVDAVGRLFERFAQAASAAGAALRAGVDDRGYGVTRECADVFLRDGAALPASRERSFVEHVVARAAVSAANADSRAVGAAALALWQRREYGGVADAVVMLVRICAACPSRSPHTGDPS